MMLTRDHNCSITEILVNSPAILNFSAEFLTAVKWT